MMETESKTMLKDRVLSEDEKVVNMDATWSEFVEETHRENQPLTINVQVGHGEIKKLEGFYCHKTNLFWPKTGKVLQFA